MMQPYHFSQVILIIFGVVITYFSLVLAQQCYLTDQKTVASGYTSCNTSAIEHGGGTTCCANGEACLTTGLCYMMFDMSINIGACTDSSWSISNCFQKCPSGAFFRLHLPNSPLHPDGSRCMVDLLTLLITPLDYGNANTKTLYRCNNNQWCCSRGGNTTSCCDDPNVATFFPQGTNNVHQIYNGSAFAPGFALSQTTASTTSASASTAKATGAKATTTRASGDGCPTTGNNSTCPNMTYNSAKTTRVGVGVGVGLVVPLFAALAASLILWLRERKRSREFRQQAAVAGQQLPWGKPSMGYGSASEKRVGQQTFHEVPGQIGDYGVAEMVGSDGRREMAASPMAVK